jgi:hypothetical protein
MSKRRQISGIEAGSFLDENQGTDKETGIFDQLSHLWRGFRAAMRILRWWLTPGTAFEPQTLSGGSGQTRVSHDASRLRIGREHGRSCTPIPV